MVAVRNHVAWASSVALCRGSVAPALLPSSQVQQPAQGRYPGGVQRLAGYHKSVELAVLPALACHDRHAVQNLAKPRHQEQSPPSVH